MDRQTTTYFVTFVVVALIVAFRIWRGSRERRLRVDVWMPVRKLLADAIAAKVAGKAVPAEMTRDRGGARARTVRPSLR